MPRTKSEPEIATLAQVKADRYLAQILGTRLESIIQAIENEHVVGTLAKISVSVSKDKKVERDIIMLEARDVDGMAALTAPDEIIERYNYGFNLDYRRRVKGKIEDASVDIEDFIKKHASYLVEQLGITEEVALLTVKETPAYKERMAEEARNREAEEADQAEVEQS